MNKLNSITIDKYHISFEVVTGFDHIQNLIAESSVRQNYEHSRNIGMIITVKVYSDDEYMCEMGPLVRDEYLVIDRQLVKDFPHFMKSIWISDMGFISLDTIDPNSMSVTQYLNDPRFQVKNPNTFKNILDLTKYDETWIQSVKEDHVSPPKCDDIVMKELYSHLRSMKESELTESHYFLLFAISS